MKNIYWLASYPKSGNTWIRILLTNYLRDSDTPANINQLMGGPIASLRTVFDEFTGVQASDLTQDEIESWRPLVYQRWANYHQEPLYLKIHDAYIHTPQGIPLIPQDATAGVLYLIRNPLDVAISFAHHNDTNIDDSIRRMANKKYAFVDNPKQLHMQLRQRLLTWSEHVSSWVDSPLPIHIVRYEDLKVNTLDVFAGIVKFFRLSVDEKRLRKAVAFSSFEQVSSQEKQFSFQEKSPKAKSFFRQGKVGDWKKKMPPELAKTLITTHREVMQRFGYLDS